MRVIHVLRKPLSEDTVAANVVKHGCGGLNIDASRVGTDDNLNGGAYAENASARHDGAENWRYKRGGAGRASLPGDTREGADAGMFQPGSTAPSNFVQPTGRWPANVILQHLDGCRCDGVKQVKPSNGSGRAGAGASGFQTSFVGGESKATGFTGGFSDEDGSETVANWICVEGCPVRALDAQSGTGESPKSSRLKTSGTDFGQINDDGWKPSGCTIYGYGDTGGASRFFKQVGGKTDE